MIAIDTKRSTRTTADEICTVCGAPADQLLGDRRDGSEHYFCCEHSPMPPMYRPSHFYIKRWRQGPGNSISQALAAPKESPEYRALRLDMYDSGLLGSYGAIKYCLSIITGKDEFAAWSDEFVDDVRRFVVSQTCPAAAQFCGDAQSIEFLVRFFRSAFERAEGTDSARPGTKMERAIELLLNHPEWTDEQIAAKVPTTIKQLQRCSDYMGLRRIAIRAEASRRDEPTR